MPAIASQVVGVIEMSGCSVPADLRPRSRAKMQRVGRQNPCVDCVVVSADLHQLRRDLRRELAAFLKRVAMTGA
jgi:hypothetical protein